MMVIMIMMIAKVMLMTMMKQMIMIYDSVWSLALEFVVVFLIDNCFSDSIKSLFLYAVDIFGTTKLFQIYHVFFGVETKLEIFR